MIYGEIISDQDYYSQYPVLLEFLEKHFENVEAGVQGDAWIWINEGKEKVMLDTFTSMRFQIKSKKVGGSLIEKVISVLKKNFDLYIYNEPEDE